MTDHGRGRALYEEIKARILDGTYAAGVLLPSTRTCAADRGLSRTTVSAVYEQLAAEGFLDTRAGARSRVAAGAVAESASTATRQVRPGRQARLSAIGKRVSRLELPAMERPPSGYVDFAYGPLAGRDFPTLRWLKAVRRVERERPARLAYEDPSGELSLRRALQSYLARARGLSCNIEQLIIVNGSQQALDLCARLLLDPGDRVVVENPGYRMAHHVFEAVGAQLRGIDVDHQGLKTEELHREPRARLAYVTPSHQFPLGSFLTIGRRHALLSWAASTGAWILEDDYDGEYRYAVRPEATLQSLDEHGTVIYIGTFSKTLSPQLRVGYMVLPHRLVGIFATAKRVMDRHVASGSQRALAMMLEDGSYDRHVRRVRRLQQTRRSALLEALDRHLPGQIEVHGAASGLHVVAWITALAREREADLVTAARRERVLVYPITPLYLRETRAQASARSAGLIIGYALLEPEQIDRGIKHVASAIRQAI